MRARWLSASVMVLALSIPTTVWADEAPVPTPSSSATTSIPTRPNHAIALAPANEGTPIGYKLVAGAVVALAAGLWIRNKRRMAALGETPTRIDVLGRTALGVRNELLVVQVDGMRLLVGMTPGAIQTLAVLETPPEPSDAAAERAEADEAPADGLRDARRGTSRPADARPTSDLRALSTPSLDTGALRSLLSGRRHESEDQDDAADSGSVETRSAPTAPRRTPAKAAKAATPRTTRIAGQARGLMLALEEPSEGKATARATRNL